MWRVLALLTIGGVALADEPWTWAVSYRDRAAVASGPFLWCDLPDRVLLVAPESTSRAFPAEVVIIRRAAPGVILHGRVTRALRCTNACGGPQGGHAGCSEVGTCDVDTTVPGTPRLRVSKYLRETFDTIVGAGGAACLPADETTVAVCATATQRAAVDRDAEGEGVVLVLAAGQALRRLPGRPARVEGGRTTYRFTDGDGDVELSYTAGALPAAALRVGARSEPCLAFASVVRAP